LVAVLITLYVNAAWWCWWFASSFGQRASEAMCLFFMGGLAWIWRARPRWRPALWTVFLVGAAWNFYIMALFYTTAISRDAPVTWGEMLLAGGKCWGIVLRFLQGAR
jgi:hypothetical protein